MHLSEAIEKIEQRAERMKLQNEYGEELLPCEKIWKVAVAFGDQATKLWDLYESGQLCTELYAKIWIRLIEDFEQSLFTMNLEVELKKLFS